MRNQFLFVLFSLSLIISKASNAQVGQLEEVVEAAIDNKEPAYIKELMELLSGNIQVLVRERKFKSQEQMLALLLTMRGMVRVAYLAARNAAFDVGGIEADNAARSAAGIIAGDAVFAVSGEAWGSASNDAFSEAHNVAYNAAYEAAKMAALNTALMGGPNIDPAIRGRIIFRVAEWTALNYFFNHIMSDAFSSIFDVTNNAAIFNLRVTSEDNPFRSFAAWNEFQRAHFAHLSAESLVLLMPWFNILDSLVFAEHQAPNALLSVGAYVQQEFDHFPREVVLMLILLASYPQVHK